MIKTEEQFNAELAKLTGVSIPRTPCKFITWNANGIKHRLAETNNEKKLKAFVEAENPDIFAVQEVHIAAHPELGRSYPMPGDNGMCDEKKLKRRRSDDAVTYDYMTHYAAMSRKPLVYLGDLNVCHMNNDMSVSADFWFEEGFFQRRPEKVPKDEKDQGF